MFHLHCSISYHFFVDKTLFNKYFFIKKELVSDTRTFVYDSRREGIILLDYQKEKQLINKRQKLFITQRDKLKLHFNLTCVSLELGLFTE